MCDFSNSLRSPPRPSPGSVNYSDADEETTHKSYPDDNSSSLSDKPSDISDSEVRHGVIEAREESVWFSLIYYISVVHLPLKSSGGKWYMVYRKRYTQTYEMAQTLFFFDKLSLWLMDYGILILLNANNSQQ